MKQNVLGMLGVTPVGGRFVTGLGNAQGALGDDGSVMMISGLGQESLADRLGQRLKTMDPNAGGAADGTAATPAPAAPATADILRVPITLWNITLPLWGWLLVAAVLGGGVSYLAILKKKGA